VTSVLGQRRSFLRWIWKGPCQDRNKSLHLSGKPKRHNHYTWNLSCLRQSTM